MPNYESYASTTKPDNNCRTCTDFKYWSKQQRQLFSKAHTTEPKSGNGDPPRTRSDCPFDKEGLGKATWGLLHTIAAFYSDHPTDDQKRDTKMFVEALSRVYPCEHCSRDFRKDLSKNPINANSQKELSLWMCNFHNRVNVKLGKPSFDCNRVNERWRDGWLDGSCD